MPWDEEIRRAKNHIKRGRYTEARMILEDLSEYDDRAFNLLSRLDSRQYGRPTVNYGQTPVVLNQTIQQVNNNSNNVSNNRGCLSDIPTFAFVLIIMNMGIWGFITVGMAGATSIEAGASALVGVLIFFTISFILYYLFWKFYWWMIALSWTFLTAFTLCAAIYGIQNLPTF